MVAIAILSLVINFPVFGHSLTDRDTLVNGVITSSCKCWSVAHDLTLGVRSTFTCKANFELFFYHLKQGIPLIYLIALICPSASAVDKADLVKNFLESILLGLVDVGCQAI